MCGPFVHRLDPVLFGVGGIYFWWYGLSYTLGFLHLHRFLMRRRGRLGLSERDVYSLSLAFASGVLAGGRVVQVLFDEWPLYRAQPWLAPAYWLGGMATHGLLLGGLVAVALFAWRRRTSFLALADVLVIPGALLLGIGRIGNFIDGQIVGMPTTVCWGVIFPDAAGVRHPVVLYDGLKNLLLVPCLLRVARANPTPGAVAARFVFWYAFLRVFVDLFRDYPTHRLALGTGQTLNIVMSLVGLLLLARSRQRRLRLRSLPPVVTDAPPQAAGAPKLRQRLALTALLLLCPVIPSNWTQDVPARYLPRHAGIERTWWYPAVGAGRSGGAVPHQAHLSLRSSTAREVR